MSGQIDMHLKFWGVIRPGWTGNLNHSYSIDMSKKRIKKTKKAIIVWTAKSRSYRNQSQKPINAVISILQRLFGSINTV